MSEHNLVWIDCEMTGLHPYLPPPEHDGSKWTPDRILEIAVICTTPELQVLDEGIELVIKTDRDTLDAMNEWCVKQHGKSGLTKRCLESDVTMDEAESRVLEYVQRHTVAGKAVLAGNSVHADRAFIRKDMPRLDAHLHYRILDVSSIKELARRWYPKTTLPGKGDSAHRAMSDIHDSINELRHYRSNIFKRPSTDEQ